MSERSIRILVVVAISTSLASLALSLVGRSAAHDVNNAPEDAAGRSASPSEDGSTAGELAQLQQEQARLAAEVKRVAGATTPAEENADPYSGLSRSERLDVEREAEADRYDSLDAALEGESRDPSWSDVQEARMEGGFEASAGDGSRLAGLDCRARLCRARVEHDSVQAQEEANERLPQTEGWNTRGSVRLVQDGDQIASIYYVAREGYALP